MRVVSASTSGAVGAVGAFGGVSVTALRTDSLAAACWAGLPRDQLALAWGAVGCAAVVAGTGLPPVLASATFVSVLAGVVPAVAGCAVPGVVAVVGVAVGLVLWTDLGGRFASFSRESRVELRKVVWPTRQETVQITLIVLVLVFLIGLFLWLVDSLLFWGVQMITGQGA